MEVHLDAKGLSVAREKADVSVTVPAQERGPQLAVKGSPFTSLEGLTGGEFTPFRPVIHLRLEDADQPGVEVTQYDPPITIRVRYTAKDVRDAGGRALILGFWDGTQWVKFKEKHQFRLEEGKQGQPGGFGVVVLSNWIDPFVGWG
jgi:hypothetical protein